MLTYREDMTPEEQAAFAAELAREDAAYADAAAFDAERCPPTADDPDGAERAAAEEQSLGYFDRFIAGDR